tara:strand:- start:366 stop:860 length:495 start_codon:yes stop_codon:yes gene_type:complete
MKLLGQRGIVFIIMLFFVMSGTAFAENDTDKQKIFHVPPKNIAKYIDNTGGQKRVLMIYTSWCPYCRKKMPGLIDLENTKPGSVIAVSVDENYSDFTGFIKRYKDAPFKFILNNGSEYALVKELKQYGAKAWKGYPTIMFLDENGKVVAQGNFSIDQMSMHLFY